ncbi:voltage-gated hydrogen channel 1 [Ambystoma mexicanum]|uniref:voltage-gated hydrogen channel 1 n=1 Tax=Ambystoma mexicanum TaxID=8296 RepID=UPI0037E9A4FE
MSTTLAHFTAVGDDHRKKWWKKKHHEAQHEPEAHHEEPKEPVTTPHPFTAAYSFRQALKWLMASHKFQIAIVVLVIVDALFVLVELLLDLNIIHPDPQHIAPRVFHYLSMSILSFFLIELFFKVYAFRAEFFHHKFEVMDAVVIVVSFVLDVVYISREDVFNAVGLLILLRLWRVARIINGIIISIQSRHEEKINKLKVEKKQLVEQVTQLKQQTAEQEEEIHRLQNLLEQHKIMPPKS